VCGRSRCTYPRIAPVQQPYGTPQAWPQHLNLQPPTGRGDGGPMMANTLLWDCF
jgi:hypothetical protein